MIGAIVFISKNKGDVEMKRLHLLKPNYVTGFLGGAGSKYHCLEIEKGLGYDALKEDVENGARQFADCLKNADRKLSRVVVVKGTKQEEVLMAVNYLAAIANSTEAEDDGFNEYESEDCDDFDFWDDEWEDEEDCEWEEVPWRIPVVRFSEIAAHDEDNIIFQSPNNLMFSGIRNVNNKRPYWKDCRNEMICILIHQKPGFGFFNFDGLTEKLSLFAENRHLFIAYVNPWEDDFAGEEVYDADGLFSYVLENTADMILVSEKEENLKQYRRLQFDNWLEKLSIHLAKGVPKNEIIEKILKMYNENKSDMMQRVLLYVQKESRKPLGEPLAREDFGVLKKYLSISTTQEKKSTERLEKELVGMENVKRQVKGIVSVMKYCKTRQKMGLGESGFHNVHLLIGAPAEYIQNAFMCDFLRVYTSPDVLGIEIGGALKNVVALAAGIADGLGCGDNAKAALITRGIVEIARLGVAMGGKIESFTGLTGIGDLIVTCSSMHSRNRRAGMLIGQGYTMQEAMDEVKMVVEGVYSAKAAAGLAKKYNISMPIVKEVNDILFEGQSAQQAITDLMFRDKAVESHTLTWDE